MNAPAPILSLRDVGWRPRRRAADIVRNVSLDVFHDEVLAIVGESGAGKSTVGRLMVGLTRPTSGEITWNGEQVNAGLPRERRFERQMVYQDPYSAMNPRLSILRTLEESYRARKGRTESARQRRVALAESLATVGLPEDFLDRFPRQLSGGQLQRASIARAFAADPPFLLCDEVVSALDVSVQAQVLNLLTQIIQGGSRAVVFISHDMAVVRQVADRIAVMRNGEVVEVGIADQVLDSPREKYTRELMDSAVATGLDSTEISFNVPSDWPRESK